MEYYGEDALPGQNPNTEKDTTRYAPESWRAGYDTLLRQMGALQGQIDVYKRGSPLDASTHMQNIATSLAKDYGVTKLSDIGATPGVISKFADTVIQERGKAPYRVQTYDVGSDGIPRWNANAASRGFTPGEPVQRNMLDYKYYNKNNPSVEIPAVKFASEGKGDGYSEYNLQAVPDGKGGINVVPVQQYSKSGLSEVVQDIGPALQVANLMMMAAGVPPVALGAGNLALQGAAGNIDDFNDALRIAAPFAIPAALQGLDIVGPSTAATTAGRVAENYGGIAGLTGIGADILGAGLSDAVQAGLTGGDVLTGALSGAAGPALTAAGKYVASGVKDAFGGLTGFNYGADLDDMGGSALEGFGPTTTNTNAGVVNLAGAGANNILGNLTDDDLNDLYGSTVLNRTDALTDRVVNPVTKIVNSGDIFGNLTDDELNDLYATTVPNTGAAASNLSVDTMAGAGSGKTVEDLYSMDARRGDTGDTIYTDKSGSSYYVDDNGDVQSLTKGQADTLLTTATAGNTGLKLDSVEIKAKHDDTDLDYPWVKDTTNLTTSAVDPSILSILTTLTQIAPVSTGQLRSLSTDQVATIDTKTAGALNTSQIAATNTSQIAAINTSQINALTPSQIASLVLTTGTGLLVSDIVGGGTKDTTPATALSTSQVGAVTTGQTALSTSQIGAVTTGQTALTTNQVGALTTIGAQGLQGIADPKNRYWQQTGKAGTGGQGDVRFFDWTTSQTPSMGGSNLAAATALSSIPAFTSAQAQAMVAPTAKRYFNAATNRYYTDPTGQATLPAGFVQQKTFKDGGEVETEHYQGGGLLDYLSGDVDLLGTKSRNSYSPSIFDFDTGIDFSGPAFSNFDWSSIGLGGNDFSGIDFDELIPAGTGYLDDGAATLNDLRWESGYFGDAADLAQNYGNEARAYTGANALDPTKYSPINAESNSLAKTVVEKLADMGAKLGEKALESIAKNPGAWLSALAGAGLGYAASKNNTVSPMGLQSLGLSQQQVYDTLKGGNYVGKATGGEIPGYGAGGGLHYLKSAEDGMADKIPATIDSKQPARLSGGEFVIPADVVSHLGNGNSEAGAKRLYEMMDKIRHARTGTKKQGKQINPAKFTPK
jgi:hypothetical protein